VRRGTSSKSVATESRLPPEMGDPVPTPVACIAKALKERAIAAPGAAALSALFAKWTVRSEGTESCPEDGMRTAPVDSARVWHLAGSVRRRIEDRGQHVLVDEPLDERGFGSQVDVVHTFFCASPAECLWFRKGR
jgi:hypothetical protein